jgi:hypothetical protein
MFKFNAINILRKHQKTPAIKIFKKKAKVYL